MEQQVVIELLNLMGKTAVDFPDAPKIKLSPHSYPQRVNSIAIDNRIVVVNVDGDLRDYNSLGLPIKQTIGQRLRLMFNSKCQGQ
jgi:hypothetical protein